MPDDVEIKASEPTRRLRVDDATFDAALEEASAEPVPGQRKRIASADNNEAFNRALDEATAEIQREREGQAGGLASGVQDFATAVGIGIAKSFLETKDFVAGEPTEDEKSPIRRSIEAEGERLSQESMVYAATIPIAQFVTGLIGAGKFVKGAQAVGLGFKVATRGGKAVAESVKAAATGAVVFDPHEERLSNAIQEVPGLRNPVTSYLAADPKDSAAEGRFKTALESLGMDAVLVPAFKASVRAYKYMRQGNAKAAERALEEAETAMANAAPPPEPAVQRPMPETIAGALDAQDPGIAWDEAAARAGFVQGLPPAIPELKPLTPKQVSKVLDQAYNDSHALTFYGSREAAEAAGHNFAKADLPWQMWSGNVTDDLNAFIANVAETREAEFTKAKGGAVQSDASVNAMVKQRVELWGEDPQMVLGVLRQAGKDANKLRVHAETATALGLKAMDEAHRVSLKMRMGNLAEWDGDRAAALEDFSKRAATASALLSYSRSIFTNAGRTLRSARRDVPRLNADDLRKLDGMNPEALAKLFEQSEGDVARLKDLLSQPGRLAKVVDGANFLLVNNLLWGWPTHLVNLAGTLFMVGARPAQRIIGAQVQRHLPESFGGIAAEEASTATAQNLRQYRYMVASLLASTRMAGKAFVEGESVIMPFKSVWFRYGSAQRAEARTAGRIQFRPANSVENIAYNAGIGIQTAIGLPTRALGFVDELSRQVSYRGMVMAEASVEADRLGLTGREYKDFINNALEKSFDASGAAINDRAIQEAKTINFQQDLLKKGWGDYSTLGHTVQTAVGSNPLFRQLAPFVRTPVNVLREGVKLTPGLNLLQREYADAIRGRLGQEAQAQAIGQMSMGTLFLTTAAVLVDAGLFTGSGPSDPDARRELIAAGWKPNSIIIQDDEGQTHYIQLGRLDPIGLVFGVVADIMDIYQHPDKRDVADNLALALGVALVGQLRERTYVRGFVQFLDALSDPSTMAARWTGQHVSNLVPFSSAFRNYGWGSLEYLHEARTLADYAMANTPGLSATVPLKYDAWGDPIRVRRGPWSAAENDIVDREMIRMGMVTGDTVAPPSPNLGEGVDLRDLALEDGRNAYEVYQQLAGHPPKTASLKDAVAKLIQSPAYQNSPDGYASTRGTRQWMLRGLMAKYRAAAKRLLMGHSKIVREAVRKGAMEARAKRAQAMGGEMTRNVQAAQNQEQMAELLRSFGIDPASVAGASAQPSAPALPPPQEAGALPRPRDGR